MDIETIVEKPNGFEKWSVGNLREYVAQGQPAKASAIENYQQQLYNDGRLYSMHELEDVKIVRDCAMDFLMGHDPVVADVIRRLASLNNLSEATRQALAAKEENIFIEVANRYVLSDIITEPEGEGFLVSVLQLLTPDQPVETVKNMAIIHIVGVGPHPRNPETDYKIIGLYMYRQDSAPGIYGVGSYILLNDEFENKYHTWIGSAVSKLTGSFALAQQCIYNPMLVDAMKSQSQSIIYWLNPDRKKPKVPDINTFYAGTIHNGPVRLPKVPSGKQVVSQVATLNSFRRL